MSLMWIPKRLVEIPLVNTAGISQDSFIRYCEHEYDSRIYTVAKEIIAENKPIIMLTGPSASGKTTTSNKIKEKLISMGKSAQVISMDNFYKNINEYPRLPDGSKDYENVTALAIDVFEKCIIELLNTGKAKFPTFNFKEEIRNDDDHLIELNDGFIIVEGIHALNPIFLDIIGKDKVLTIYAGLREEYSLAGQRALPTRDIRLLRRMIRDYHHRGHSAEKTIEMWKNVCLGEDKYIRIFKPNADLLMDTSFSYEILIMKDVLKEFTDKTDVEENQKIKEILEVFDNINEIPSSKIPENSMIMEFYG